MKTLFKNARILTMMDDKIIFGSVIINEDKIENVTQEKVDETNFDKIIDCNGNLLMPGFKNAHAHSGMTFLRSVADDSSLEDWLFKEIFPREANLHPGVIKDLTKVAILEYLSSGTTACLDQYFYIEEFKETCDKFGFRSSSIGMYDKDKRPYDYLYKKFFESKKSGVSDIVIGLHAEYTSDNDMLENNAKLIKSTGSMFYAHLGETKSEVDGCYQRYGVSPVELFNNLGLFDNGGAIFHGVYLNDNDIKILKEKNITVVSCPASNLKLASGIAEIKKLMNSGIRIALGTDGPASNNSLDMFREMYLATNLQKLLDKNPISIPAFEVLKMATVNGAIAMGYENAKYLAPGQLADIIMIDLHRPCMQPINNIISNLVYSGGKEVVKMTMINGKILYQDGQFYVGEDVEDIYKKVQELTNELNVIKSHDAKLQ